jgi:hypothetical protein
MTTMRLSWTELALAWLCLTTVPGPRAAEGVPLLHLARSNDALALSWTAAGPGTAYTVQARETLGESLWLSPPAPHPWPIPGTAWVDARGGVEPTRFYRVLAVPAAERGKLLAATPTGMLTTANISNFLSIAGVRGIEPQYDVQLYKIVYESVGPWGAHTRASGVLALPQGASGALPLVSYQHGTLVQTNEAPSISVNSSELLIGVVFATTGYAAVLPDYLGLGDSEGLHPYHHARSEATACVDLLRAARGYCAARGVALSGKLFLCGYSQGGHVTMALHRELETFHTNEFPLTASAPMAGAYDLSGVTADDFLSGRPQPNPYYFAYLLAAYQEVYHLAPTLADLLATPYDTTLPPLLRGSATGGQINAAMPSDPALILKPEYLTAFRSQPHHPMRQALRDNDLLAWTPRAALRMFHCQGDRDVVFANSQVALASFHARGATHVQLIDPLPTANHGGCVLPSLLQAKAWFDALRQ